MRYYNRLFSFSFIFSFSQNCSQISLSISLLLLSGSARFLQFSEGTVYMHVTGLISSDMCSHQQPRWCLPKPVVLRECKKIFWKCQ
jgi:hypothetical protein